MNMMKKNGGFTLVELIVVIAILAILAGVAVPAYSGYITKAEEAKDLTQLDAIKTAAVFAYTEAAVNDEDADLNVTEITVSDAGVVNVNGAADATDVSEYVTFTAFVSDKYADGAEWTAAGGWEALGE